MNWPHTVIAMLAIDVQVDEPFADRVDAALIEQAVAAALAAEGVDGAVELSVLVSDDAELHRLNRLYRGVDRPTDVLSFADQPDDGVPTGFVRPTDLPRYLGDLAISYQRVVAQAAEYGHSPARELAFLTVHGVLHLLGYDHERGPDDEAAMRARAEMIMAQIGLPRE